jgi:hypothetical protein
MSEHIGSADDRYTLPMEVANTGFMLDRLGQDCSPLQFLRELTQNSLEAILAVPDEKGAIVWDVDWNRYELTGTFKVACIDTGIGMTGPEMETYINKLSSSGRVQAYDRNFGVGAKVAAATRNHVGLVYLSWKDGAGSMVHLWRDPDTGRYGLQQLARPDGTFGHWAHVTDDIKPELIDRHGTMVILLGNEVDADTMQAPKDAPSPSRWIARYLNTRYFEFPKGVSLKAREGWEYPRTNTDTNVLRRVTGQAEYLVAHQTSSGCVPLTNAQAHWWILKDEPALSQNSGFVASNGHMAALYQDELYEMVTGRAGVARLQLFGVIFGYSRVAIYVEPDVDGQQVMANTARTNLLLFEEALPWADWAAEFRASMPTEIEELMASVTAGVSTANHKDAIRERLRQIRELFRVSRYRRTPTGDVDVADTTVGGRARSDGSNTGVGEGSTRGGRGGRAGDIYALFLASDGDPATEVAGDSDPDVLWISVADGTRTAPFLEDRAAKYLPERNMLQINEDFRVFQDMIDRWCTRYQHVPGARPIISDVVKEWFEQALIETVIGVQALGGSQEWGIEHLGRGLNEEALSAAVMQRYHVDVNIRRTLGAKLGSLKEKVA